jgi:hypothetical protein
VRVGPRIRMKAEIEMRAKARIMEEEVPSIYLVEINK